MWPSKKFLRSMFGDGELADLLWKQKVLILWHLYSGALCFFVEIRLRRLRTFLLGG